MTDDREKNIEDQSEHAPFHALEEELLSSLRAHRYCKEKGWLGLVKESEEKVLSLVSRLLGTDSTDGNEDVEESDS